MRAWWRRSPRPGPGLPTIVLGAGDAARELVRALAGAPDYGLRPIGFLDDNPRLRRVNGLPVLGRLDDLPAVAQSAGARAALVAIPSLPPGRIAELIEKAANCGLVVRHLPSFLAAVERDMRLSDLRRVRVDELLGRDEVHVASTLAVDLMRGRRVLVTGAGGSIGSELCRQIKRFEPAALYLLDHDESNLHGLHLDLAGSGLLDNDEIFIADIRDRPRLEQIFTDTRPEIVFHAAAHKHLPLLERHPCEGVKTNVLGTQHLIELAVAHGTERFVLISTDKAADPTSVLGATKRLAELVVRAVAAGSPTTAASVRFGNVLGSRGSLLTVLADQMARERAVTVTHPEVTRFFMTVEEAVGLVLEAVTLAEHGETFVLDMGEPVSILDLVHRYAAALNVPEVRIQFTGLRPGEKLNEKVFSDAEVRQPTAHPKIWAARPSFSPRDAIPAGFLTGLAELYRTASSNEDDAAVALLRRIVPEYEPSRPEPAAASAPYPDGF